MFSWLLSSAPRLSVVARTASAWQIHHQQQQLRTINKMVRVICIKDLPNGKAYKDDVIHVKAGYARNFLIPQKFVKYATRQNFAFLGIQDPEKVAATADRNQLAADAQATKKDVSVEDLKAADLLRKYLSNKILIIQRRIDDLKSEMIPPGNHGVTADNVRTKLSQLFKIDLEEHEQVHIRPEPIESLDALYKPEKEQELKAMLHDMGPYDETSAEIRKLGHYLCRIWLKGDHMVPLKLSVIRNKRASSATTK